MSQPRKPLPKQTGRVRRCLMCGRDFVSEGSHNRVCKRCKETNAWRSPPDMGKLANF